MNSTKKRLIYLVLVLLVLFILGVVYIVLSGAKGTKTNQSPSPVSSQSLIPGQSTREDIIRIKGNPSIVSNASGVELLNYEVNQINEQDVYGVSNGVLYFVLENNVEPGSFNDFSKTHGQGIIYFGEDDAITWHVYPTKGIGAAVADDQLVKSLIFAPMQDSQFINDVGSFLGLSKESPQEEEIIPELE